MLARLRKLPTQTNKSHDDTNLKQKRNLKVQQQQDNKENVLPMETSPAYSNQKGQ